MSIALAELSWLHSGKAMSPTTDRYHSLDFLRAFAMFLGILLHGVMSFTQIVIPFWPARNDEQSPIADLFIFIVHGFRMQVFFLLAGFFGALLYQRYRLAKTLRHRFLRIAVPFGLAILFIQPTLQALWLIGDPSALRFMGYEPNTSMPVGERLSEHFLTGRFLEYIAPFHLWFLLYLIWFFILIIPLLGLGSLLDGTRVQIMGDRCFRNLLSWPGKVLVLALMTAPLVWPMEYWGLVDTPVGWRPQPQILGYYFFFFVTGWQLWRHRDLLQALTRRWAYSLIGANTVVVGCLLYLVFMALDGKQGKAEMPGAGIHALICYISALYTWLMVGGLIGAFQHFFHGESRWVRWFADASYWCYLWHLTPIVLLQILLASMPLPGLLKYLVIIGIAMVILLATYEWCVRYTRIGAILNGRKQRAG